MGDDLRVDLRKLSPAQREVVRMRVMAAVGEGMSVVEAARVFGVAANSVRNWQVRVDSDGVAGLKSRSPGRRVGQLTKLSASQAEALVEAVIEYEPGGLGLGGKLWTRRKVAVLAWRLFGVRFTDQGMGKLLRRMGFSFQRPDKAAVEADPHAMCQWVEVTFPALRQQAYEEGAVVLFGDQVGVRSDQLSGRTWGRKGSTPQVRQPGNRFGLNAMSIISMRGDVGFTIMREEFNTDVFLTFLARLIRQFDRKIHLIVDGHSAHRAKKTRAWVAQHGDHIQLHYLPAYAPHLNPDELVNADLKRTLADQTLTNRHQMEQAVRSFFHRIQKLPHHVKTYFQAPHTKYTTSTI